MPSEKQIKARENFVKNYAQKKKGSKSGKFKKSSSGFKPIPSSKLRKGTISHTMAIRAEGKKKTKAIMKNGS